MVDLFGRCAVRVVTQGTTTILVGKPASLFLHKSLRVRLQIASQLVAERASDQGFCCCTVQVNPGLTRKQPIEGESSHWFFPTSKENLEFPHFVINIYVCVRSLQERELNEDQIQVIPPYCEAFCPQKMDHAGDGNTWPPFSLAYPPLFCYIGFLATWLSTLVLLLEEMFSLSIYVL